jgi:hypothetical protein
LPLGPEFIASLGTRYYEVEAADGGRLSAHLSASGFPARLSLVDAQGQPLAESDASSIAGGASLVVNIPPGTVYLKVQSLGAAGSFRLSADVTPSTPALDTIPSLFLGFDELAAGDFFGRGITDLVAPDGIHLGNGDGTFQSKAVDGPLGDADWTVKMLAAGDFSRDGRPDIALVETSPDGSTTYLRVLVNEGDGEFRMGAPFAVGLGSIALHVIDFGNGIVDLAVADVSSGNVAIFLGDGTGVFVPGPVIDGGVQPIALASGRFGDGYVDLIVADLGSSDPDAGQPPGLNVFQIVGPEQFQLSATIALPSEPSALAAGDFDGNQALDLAVAQPNTDSVSILLNNGDATFGAAKSYAVGSIPYALVAGDFGNGHVDLAIANNDSNDVSVLLGNGHGTFAPQLHFGVGVGPASLIAADLNGDGRPDLATGNVVDGSISVLIGRGDGTFQDNLSNPVGDAPYAVVSADLNHDGHVDMITANYQTNDITVLLGEGDGTFAAGPSFPAGAGPIALAVGDFNHDGRLDVAVADAGDSYGNGSGVSILLGFGDGTFSAPVLYPAGVKPSSIVAGDFTGNGVLDLAVANEGSNDVSILLGNGDGTFQAVVPAIALGDEARVPISMTAGDFGNGQIDLAVANQGSSNVSILLGDGHGGFRVLPQPIGVGTPGDDSPVGIVSGYFTGNDQLDLAVAISSKVGPDYVSILVGQGHGLFTPLNQAVQLRTSTDARSITAGFFFGSGSLGLAVAEFNSNAVSLIERDAQGVFQVLPELALGPGGSPLSITAGDFTGDKTDDLGIARQAPNSVTVELSVGNGQFAEPGSVALAQHNTPLVADLNGDGLPDVAIVDGAGEILFRAAQPNQPGTFYPPVTIQAAVDSSGNVKPVPPSRDIAAIVVGGNTLLASVDATDDAVTLLAYSGGLWRRVGVPLKTGLKPAQIIVANLQGTGADDLVIRNAGDGTLTVYLTDATGAFLPPISLAVGPGISDVSVADANQDGFADLLLSNQIAGVVKLILNQGNGKFSSPVIYRAGIGATTLINATDSSPLYLSSQDATAGAVVAALTSGAPPDLVAINPGSETLGVLAGLGTGQFANPLSLATPGAAIAVRVADFNGDGNPDLAILGQNGLSVWLGNGQGGFTSERTYDVGPDPTGLSIADVNADNLPDLEVGNAHGDVLILLGTGDGGFQTPTAADNSVGLAVGNIAGRGVGSTGPTFIFVNQASDQVAVQHGPQSPPTVLADRTTGLLVPGPPVIADLNRDGNPYLVVPNGGGNSVLVYPGVSGANFGQPDSAHSEFFTGTNPYSVVVADVNGDNRPDLLVADRGSNDISILLNQASGSGVTFVQGPRLKVGAGPVGVLYGDFNGDGIPDILVSDSASKDLMLLPGLGGGFFNDTTPTVFAMTETPGPIFAGRFTGGAGLDVVALDPGTSDVTLVSGIGSGAPTSQIFSSGGFDPVAAFSVPGGGGFDDLVIANNGDGAVALVEGGPFGLSLGSVNNLLAGLGPTSLALKSQNNNELELYAATEGKEAATLLVLFTPSDSAGLQAGPGMSLLPIQQLSLPLIASFLPTDADLNVSESTESAGTPAAVAASGATVASLGQSLQGKTIEPDEDLDDEQTGGEPEIVPPAPGERALWKRVMIGLEKAFEEFRRATRQIDPPRTVPARSEKHDQPATDRAGDLFDSARRRSESSQLGTVDAAIDALSSTSRARLAMPGAGQEACNGTRLQLEPVWLTWFAAQLVTFRRSQLIRVPSIPRERRNGPRRRAWPGRFHR